MRDTAQQNCGQQNQKVSPGRTVLTNLYKSQCEGRRDVRKVRYMEERKVEKMEMVHILLWTWGRWWGQPQRLKGEGETKAQRTELFFQKSRPVVQLLSRVRLFVTPWTAARQASLSFTISQSSLRLMCIESAMPSNHLIFCHPLLLLPSTFPSIRDCFSNESALHIK